MPVLGGVIGPVLNNQCPVSSVIYVRNAGPPGYDYYLAPWGNDANAGTRTQPFLTLNKLRTTVNALAQDAIKSAHVASGTYTVTATGESLYFTPSNTGVSITIDFADNVIIDTSGTSGATHGIGAGTTATAVFNIANAQFTGNAVGSANGISSAGSANVTVTGNGAVFSGYDDGVSSHDSSHIELIGAVTGAKLNRRNDDPFDAGEGITFEDCSKSTFAMVHTSTYAFSGCKFVAKSGASLGIGAITGTATGTIDNCWFVPIEAGQGVTLRGQGATNSRIGTTSLRVAFIDSPGALTDCYLHSFIDGDRSTSQTRCYGRVTTRMRSGGTQSYSRCCFVGGASGSTNSLHYQNAAIGTGAWSAIDCVISGYATAIGSGFGATEAGDWHAAGNSVTYCCFRNNSTNIDADLVSLGHTDSTDGNITTDPAFPGTLAGYDQTEYVVGDAGSCVGAGSAGGNIGFTLADQH